MKKAAILLLFFAITLKGFSQIDTNAIYFTPDHLMDTVYDKEGKKYLLRDLQIEPLAGYPSRSPQITTSCSAGYFNIYYATNSDFDLISNPTHIARRDVLCKVFTDISNLISSPLSAVTNTNNYRVNILVGDPTQAINTSTAFLGGASSMYAEASNPASANPGISDNMVWKTIISGKDAYINVASPQFVVNGQGNFYHGSMIFNFQNYSWNLDVNNPTMSNQAWYDFYSVALHEATHLLGFGSLIGYGGVSTLGVNNNYFARYDKFLRTSAGVPLIPTASLTCYNYGTTFSVSPSIIAPSSCTGSGINLTTCGTAVKYSGATSTVSVFTPSCFVSGSSLGHFEDICSVPAGFSTTCTATPANNDLYYCMSNANSTGNCYIKRYLKPEEKSVLCDLGYSVNAVYNPSTGATYAASVCAGANFNYSITCSTDMPVGINDGLNNSGFLYASATNTLAIPISSVLANDFNTSTITCVEAVYNNGTIGFSGGNITFTANAGVGGVILLRYLPISSTGIKGNITYIFAFINPANCNPPNACNIVQNGGFENLSAFSCGSITPSAINISCWRNPGFATPDLFTQSSCAAGFYQLGVNAIFNTTVVNTHNPSSNSKVIGVTANALPYVELFKNYLSSPLQPGQTYMLNCWLYNAANASSNVNPGFSPVVFNFASDQSLASSYSGNTFPTPLTSIAGFTLTQFNTWIPYTYTFTFSGSQPHNSLYFGVNFPSSVILGYPNTFSQGPYVLIDDISILPISQSPTVTIPSTVACTASAILNLMQYAQPTGGVFSGPGVTVSGGVYDFNANYTLTPGTYGITYSYTNTTTGCVQNLSVPVTIQTYTGSAATFTLPSPLCRIAGSIPNLSVTVSPTTIATSGVFSGIGVYQVPLSPPIYGLGISTLVPLGVQTYSYSNLSCGISLTATTNILPAFDFTINITNPSNCLTTGQTATLTAPNNQTTTVTYTWWPGPLTTSLVTVTPTTTTVYTVTASNGVCSATKQFTVYVTPPVAINFTNTPSYWCLGQNVYYLENYLAAGTPTGGVWSGYGGIFTASVGATAVYVNPVTPAGTYTIDYTYTYPNTTCNFSNTFTVSITGFSLTASGPVSYCANLSLPATISATATPSTGVTFTWMPGPLSGSSTTVSPGSNTIYTVTASIGTQCTATNTVSVLVSTTCCQATNYMNGAPTSGTYTGSWAINQNVTINSPIVFDNAEFKIAKDVTITIANGGTLSLQYCHLYSCGDMWNGIIVNNGGQVISPGQVWNPNLGQVFDDNRVLIEDAKTAISMNGSTNTSNVIGDYNIVMQSTVFNKNYVGISFKNYNYANRAPIEVNNCVFSCRTLTFNATTWPAPTTTLNGLRYSPAATPTTGFASPYDLQSAAVVNLKAPYSTITSLTGILFDNVGVLSSSVFYGAEIGNESSDTYFNLFDAQAYSIDATNSNLRSVNNVFQNTKEVTIVTCSPKCLSTTIGGTAIRQVINTNMNANLNLNAIGSGSTSTSYGNRFWNCHTGVEARNTFRFNMERAIFRSTQTTSGFIAYGPGNSGVYAVTNRFQYNMRFNEFANICNAINVPVYAGTYDVGAGVQTGIYAGNLVVNNNYFGANYSVSGPLGGKFMSSAVSITSPNSTTWQFASNTGLFAENNTILRTYRGIQVSGLAGYSCTINNNYITLIDDNLFSALQRGIEVTSTQNKAVVSTNTLSTNNINNTLTALCYFGANTGTNSPRVTCNDLSNSFKAFEFNATNLGTYWRGNLMSGHIQGLTLSNSATISAQGSSGNPQDNTWSGFWVMGTNFGTWVETGSDAVNSPIWYQSSLAVPTNSGSVVPLARYGAPGTFNLTTGAYSCVGGGARIASQNNQDEENENVSSSSQKVNNTLLDESEYVNGTSLYRFIDAYPSEKNNNPAYASFYNAKLNTSMDQFVQVEKALYNQQLGQAQSLNNAISINNPIEANYKSFYSLYIKHLSGILNGVDSSSILALANMCPGLDGEVVYQARALYNTIYKTVIVYNENCNPLSQVNLKKSNIDKVDKENNWTIELYPNPANTFVNVVSSNEKDSLRVSITDVSGKTLFVKQVTTSNFICKLDLDLLPGAYFVIITNDKNKTTTKKLIIAK